MYTFQGFVGVHKPLHVFVLIHKYAHVHPTSLFNILSCFIYSCSYAEAEKDCSLALALDDSYVKAYYRRATARVKLQRLDDAKLGIHNLLRWYNFNIHVHVLYLLYPESQSTKNNSANRWGHYDEMMTKWWWNLWWKLWGSCCEREHCLACVTGYWDPEFDPSVEEIMDYQWYMAIPSVCFLWRVRTLGGISLFSLACGRWRSRLGQLAQAVCPNIMQYGVLEYAQFVDNAMYPSARLIMVAYSSAV